MFGQLTKLLPATILDKNIARWQALPTVLFLTYCLAPGEVYTVLHFLTSKYPLLTRNIAVCQSSSHVLSFLTMAVYCFYICEPFRIVYIVLKFRLQSTKDKLKYITKQTED